jgi:hypothetical protein
LDTFTFIFLFEIFTFTLLWFGGGEERLILRLG